MQPLAELASTTNDTVIRAQYRLFFFMPVPNLVGSIDTEMGGVKRGSIRPNPMERP